MITLLHGILEVLNPTTLAYVVLGVATGIIFGAIPGLSTTMCIALFLPLTFSMDMYASMAILMGVYIGGVSGGLVSAVLINVPGTTASLTTCWDGHPMAQKGDAAKALGLGIVFSFLGGLFSIICLMLIAPQLAKVAIQFGNFELFALYFFALTMIVTMSSNNLIKGCISGFLGILAGMIGPSAVEMYPRFTFGSVQLEGGFQIVPVMVGIFAVSEMFMIAKQRVFKIDAEVRKVKITGFGFSIREFIEEKWNFLRSSVIGVLIGILPGIGGSLSSVLAYDMAKKASKTPEKFGTGINAGIVASETANNASIGGAMIPLLTLGIPGDGATAILLGAFTMKGVQPGPLVFVNNTDLMFFIFASLLVANVIMIICEFFSIRVFVKLLKIPKNILFPIIILLCAIGCYSINHRTFDVYTMIGFGVLGYLMKSWSIPLQPFILGFLLGFNAETQFRRALIYSDGSYAEFFTHPISCLFLVAAAFSIVYALARNGMLKKKKAAEAAHPTVG